MLIIIYITPQINNLIYSFSNVFYWPSRWDRTFGKFLCSFSQGFTMYPIFIYFIYPCYNGTYHLLPIGIYLPIFYHTIWYQGNHWMCKI